MTIVVNGTNTPTAGGVTYGNGTEYATTAAGTTGQVLTSAGSSAPTWAAPATGAMTFISVQTVSGTPSTLDFTTGISSTYDDYVVVFENVATSAAAALQMLFYKSGAFQTTVYRSNYIYCTSAGGTVTSVGETTTFTISRQGSTTGGNLRSGTISLYNLNSATAYASACNYTAQNTGASATGADNTLTFGGGTEGTAAAVTQIRFQPSTGTFTSGTFRLYGLQKS